IDVIKGPFSPNPNIKFLYINDPDGYEVQLVEIIK
ncbi:MAG: VOC family protein, partial [Fusobacteria bacterium]|nr:VOC family protein [Fusobacteriota bacterium]